jgi:rSAM/selenodomain-associated transferase 2
MRVSAIIPIVNEARRVQQAVDRAWVAGADEVIVVDGQSTDGTYELAGKSTCSLLQTTPGRANQQNHGVKQAIGDVVLFLHADTWLEKGSVDQIRTVLDDERVLAGAFCQKIESDWRMISWIQAANANRIRWFNLAYGDQGLFVRKAVFDRLGGFPEVQFLEDYILSQRLRKLSNLALLPGPLHVDARRWEKNGPIRQTLRNWLIIAAYRFGVSPDRLAKFYRRHDQG